MFMARGDFPSSKQDQFMVRFPDGMRDDIRQSAEISGRSMNAEIIQRLKQSYKEPDADELCLHLPYDLWNSLMTDAAVNEMGMEDRAIHILYAAYDENIEYSKSLARVEKLVDENADLVELVSHMRAKEDADFLLYYSKVVQLAQFAKTVLAARTEVPPHIAEIAEDIAKLGAAEMQTLHNRHDDAMFKKRLIEHSRQLNREIIENQGSGDEEDEAD
jgi:hypothetical protein